MLHIDNLKISKAISDDAEGIQTLTIESSKGMYELCGWSPKEIEDHFPTEKNKEGAERLRKNIPTFTEENILFVAKDEQGKVVGCCLAEKLEDKNTIEAVYVLPEFQGLGLAKKLYGKVYERLNHYNDTFLDVFSLNSKAINFYKKQGFSETGKKTFDERFKNSKGEMLEITEMILHGI
jgi:ribosomal protein S18 acetylase RimI-like enzyme